MKRYLLQFGQLPEGDWQLFTEKLQPRQFSKKQYLPGRDHLFKGYGFYRVALAQKV
ncbi:MAG TPA: hypothetical protein VLD19_14730 [Chitinophagaceae bacterium]|nr:hypothetical protein [Chitinophagaceae bacterium]